MRLPHLLILVSALVLTACAKKDLETEDEPTPPPAEPVASAPAPELPGPGTNNPFRVPDATTKLPEAQDARGGANSPVTPAPSGNDTATVTVRPPTEVPPASDNNE